MRMISIAITAFLLVASIALAQQDPNDLWLQDSIIIGSVHIDSGVSFATIPVYAVTDDSVGFFNLPITWRAPQGGVHGTSGTSYFPPVNRWAVFDSVVTPENYFRMFGIYNLPEDSTVPPLVTNELRVQIITLRFAIDLNTPGQLITIDSTYDSLGGPLGLGLIDGLTEFRPAFQAGFLSLWEVGVDENDVMPSHFELSQNYPNPFNARTTIRYDLGRESDVSIDVFDILGRRLEALISERQEAGPHQVTWDAEDYPSGIYFYRLKAGDDSEINRMLLIR